MKKNHNRSNAVVVDNVLSNLVKGLHIYVLIFSKEYKSLGKNLQALEYQFKVLDRDSYSTTNLKLRDLHVDEFVN